MSETILAVEARQRLGELLNRVALRQEEIIIQRAGKPLARISPITHESVTPRGKMDFRKAAGLGAEIWRDTQATDYVRQERDEWDQ
jgi:prevent-host-death family protein